ncbi:MAG: TIGR01777 family oxidoreductase [Chloroflexota bacterium]
MRVIITGGTGLIGRQLAPRLIREGHEVVILSRSPESYERRFPEALRPHLILRPWNAMNADGWGDLINKDTVIINLAGENVANWRWTLTHRRIVLQSRLDTSRAVSTAIATAPEKPRALLQASAVGYYGSRGSMAIGEITTPGDGWRAEVCKLWEAETETVSAVGVRRVLLRIGIVLDQSGGALPPLLLAARMMGSRLGSGQQWVPWVHNADITNAIVFLINNSAVDGPVNIVAPAPVTNAELLRTIGRVHRWPNLIPVPATALKLVLGEMATTVLDSQRIYPSRLLDCGFTFQHSHLEPALRDLLNRPKR